MIAIAFVVISAKFPVPIILLWVMCFHLGRRGSQ